MCDVDLLHENDWRKRSLISSRGCLLFCFVFFLLRIMYLNVCGGRQGHYRSSLISLLLAVVQRVVRYGIKIFELCFFLYTNSKMYAKKLSFYCAFHLVPLQLSMEQMWFWHINETILCLLPYSRNILKRGKSGMSGLLISVFSYSVWIIYCMPYTTYSLLLLSAF